MTASEYLVRHGRLGDFGRFRAEPALACERGQRVVVRTYRGLEVGEVLHEATESHARFLPNTTVGALVRRATAEDLAVEQAREEQGWKLLRRAAELADSLSLPLTFLDAEILLDGRRGVLHHLTGTPCDPNDLVRTLAREFDLVIELTNLHEPSAVPAQEESGCGSCGSEGGDGCGSCGSGGCGSCDSKEPSREHFAHLREAMERRRTSLL